MNENETFVTIQRHGRENYTVVELPARASGTTESHQLASQSDALDHIEQTWTEAKVVGPEELAEEQVARRESGRNWWFTGGNE